MDRALHLHDGNNGRPHRATETTMSHQKPTTIGGVGAVEVTIHGTDAANVKRTGHARGLIHHAGIALEEPAFAVLATQAELAQWPTIGNPRLAARLIPLVSLLG
jgi:hypothetical protein